MTLTDLQPWTVTAVIVGGLPAYRIECLETLDLKSLEVKDRVRKIAALPLLVEACRRALRDLEASQADFADAASPVTVALLRRANETAGGSIAQEG